jgi:hypothetical protein
MSKTIVLGRGPVVFGLGWSESITWEVPRATTVIVGVCAAQHGTAKLVSVVIGPVVITVGVDANARKGEGEG